MAINYKLSRGNRGIKIFEILSGELLKIVMLPPGEGFFRKGEGV